MLSMLKSFIKCSLITSFFFLLSCAQTKGNDQSNEKPSSNSVEKEVINENYQAELQQHMAGLQQMDHRNQELKKEKEEIRKEEELREVKSWLIGTWEWTGNIYGQRVWARLVISDDYIVAPSIYGIEDQGSYRIDLENQTIHYGNYSYAKIDTRRKLIYADEGEPYRKISNSTSFSANGGGNSYRSNQGNYGATTAFRADIDVINYTSFHTFRNNAGNRIKINFQGMYVNGSLVTNAPRVLNFNGTSATISVSSPYTGGGTMIIRVDASRGTITDGSGDVFWMVD